MGFCPKHNTVNDACSTCQDEATAEAVKAADRNAYHRGYMAGKKTITDTSRAVREERARCVKEARLAKAASLWMGKGAFDKLISRIENPKRRRTPPTKETT